MSQWQPATSGRMQAFPSLLHEGPPKPCTGLGRDAAFQELQGTEQTQVEHGSHPTGDNILKRAHI